MIVAMGRERMDMIYNILLLVMNLVICLVGLQWFKSLSVVYVAIFLSFGFFQVLQDGFLVRKKISTIRFVVCNYGLLMFSVIAYELLTKWVRPTILFFGYWLCACTLFIISTHFKRQQLFQLKKNSIRFNP
jgi:hypothetical protein